MLKKFVLICLFALPSLAIEHSIKVTVDNNSITATDIRERSKLIILSSGMPNNSASYKLVHDKVRDILIDEALIDKEALKHDLNVDSIEIDNALIILAQRNGIPPDQILSFFKNKNVNDQELKRQLRHQILWSKIVGTLIQPNINITEREIEESRVGIERAAKSAAEIADLKLAEIVLYYQNNDDVKTSKDFATKLVSQIKQGADFGNMAKEFSQAQSAQSYGEIGWVTSNQIQPRLASKLMRLNIGGIDVIVLEDGIHIFKLLGKKIVSSPIENITDEEIREFLIERKIEMATKAYLKKLRQQAHIQLH